MVQLKDGRVLAVFRVQFIIPLWKAYSSTIGKTWSEPVAMVGEGSKPMATPHAVWPQLALLSNGILVLASGRPCIRFWVSMAANGNG